MIIYSQKMPLIFMIPFVYTSIISCKNGEETSKFSKKTHTPYQLQKDTYELPITKKSDKPNKQCELMIDASSIIPPPTDHEQKKSQKTHDFLIFLQGHGKICSRENEKALVVYRAEKPQENISLSSLEIQAPEGSGFNSNNEFLEDIEDMDESPSPNKPLNENIPVVYNLTLIRDNENIFKTTTIPLKNGTLQLAITPANATQPQQEDKKENRDEEFNITATMTNSSAKFIENLDSKATWENSLMNSISGMTYRCLAPSIKVAKDSTSYVINLLFHSKYSPPHAVTRYLGYMLGNLAIRRAITQFIAPQLRNRENQDRIEDFPQDHAPPIVPQGNHNNGYPLLADAPPQAVAGEGPLGPGGQIHISCSPREVAGRSQNRRRLPPYPPLPTSPRVNLPTSHMTYPPLPTSPMTYPPLPTSPTPTE